MTTHELAKALALLAKILRRTPNVPLEDFSVDHKRPTVDVNDPFALSALVAFSKFDKNQWHELIKTYRLPIPVTASHSARDLIGKVMSYYAEHPEARKRLTESVEKHPSKASPELRKALATLLRD